MYHCADQGNRISIFKQLAERIREAGFENWLVKERYLLSWLGSALLCPQICLSFTLAKNCTHQVF
jgi:hypothetical protein